MKGVFDTTQEHSQSYPFHKDKNDELKVNFEIAGKIQTNFNSIKLNYSFS